MSKSVEDVQILKDALQAWMDRNDLFSACCWMMPGTFPHEEYGAPCYLVLRMGKRMYDIIWCVAPGHPHAALFLRLRKEFSEMVHCQGFCFDFGDAGLVGPGDVMLLKEYYDD